MSSRRGQSSNASIVKKEESDDDDPSQTLSAISPYPDRASRVKTEFHSVKSEQGESSETKFVKSEDGGVSEEKDIKPGDDDENLKDEEAAYASEEVKVFHLFRDARKLDDENSELTVTIRDELMRLQEALKEGDEVTLDAAIFDPQGRISKYEGEMGFEWGSCSEDDSGDELGPNPKTLRASVQHAWELVNRKVQYDSRTSPKHLHRVLMFMDLEVYNELEHLALARCDVSRHGVGEKSEDETDSKRIA